jgi:hypothetical protein
MSAGHLGGAASVCGRIGSAPGSSFAMLAIPVVAITAWRFPNSALRFSLLAALFAAALVASAAEAGPALHPPPANQAAEYQAEVPKTIIQLQQFRQTTSIVAEGSGGRRGTATLVELNPQINTWLLLTLDWGEGGERAAYHLENPNPREQRIVLDGNTPQGIRISSGSDSVLCDLWSGSPTTALELARRSALPYAPLCGGRLYLRNPVRAGYTNLERVTGFLRDHVWGGEKIIGFVRQELYRDAFMERESPGAASPSASGGPASSNAPQSASLSEANADRSVMAEHLGIDLADSARDLTLGRWYPARGAPGVYVSVIQPKAIATDILGSYRNIVNNLDPKEADALVYLVAFDLAEFDLGFALGSEHPRVGWSERTLSAVRIENVPGPDGIDSVAPLVTNGMVSPALAARTAATFTGGFKRQHGAFRYGALALQNYGSHYGFIEQGTVFSKLQPGLATLYVLNDGTVNMQTWTKNDDRLLSRIKHARQNGVPLIERDAATGVSVPGSLVARWGPGNWSGSAEENLRTLRAGACLQETASRRFLVYGYFSAATPSAMARVYQAYGCKYAMHLDMNALEHTYLALYVRKGDQIVVGQLIQGMAEVDKKASTGLVPRFLGFPDNRDFFYLMRR